MLYNVGGLFLRVNYQASYTLRILTHSLSYFNVSYFNVEVLQLWETSNYIFTHRKNVHQRSPTRLFTSVFIHVQRYLLHIHTFLSFYISFTLALTPLPAPSISFIAHSSVSPSAMFMYLTSQRYSSPSAFLPHHRIIGDDVAFVI